MVSVCCTPWFDSGYMLGVSLRGLLSSTLQKTAESPQFQFIDCRRHSLRYAEAVSHGPACLADQRDFAVAVHAWLSMPLVCSRAGFLFRSCSSSSLYPCRCAELIPRSRQFVRRFVGPGIPQLLKWGSTSLSTGRAGSLSRRGTEAGSIVQTVRFTMDIPELLYTVADDPVVLVVRVHRCRRGEDSRAPMVALGEKLVMLRPLRVWALLGAAHHSSDELMVRFFRALYTGTGPGIVSTGTRPP